MSLDISLCVMNGCDCPHCNSEHLETEVFDANITHNLGVMAREAGIYHHLWRPEELNITKAKELIEPLTNGLSDMKNKPEHYKKFNSSNGWGLYEHFIPWIEKYLNACIEYPDAEIRISR